jgi:hypothetical protein
MGKIGIVFVLPMAMMMRMMRHKSKVSALIPPSTPDRKQQQLRTRQLLLQQGAAAMECATLWLGTIAVSHLKQ